MYCGVAKCAPVVVSDFTARKPELFSLGVAIEGAVKSILDRREGSGYYHGIVFNQFKNITQRCVRSTDNSNKRYYLSLPADILGEAELMHWLTYCKFENALCPEHIQISFYGTRLSEFEPMLAEINGHDYKVRFCEDTRKKKNAHH